MNIKETFLKLTEYTIPYGYEHLLEKYLPKGYKKDEVGNYYIEIGNSETLFTTHLDTYSDKYEKVNHVIDGNIIKTDGSTILGGDNKIGMSILLYLIHNNKPGTYYFFIGEEPILSGGLFGSFNILKKNPDFFKKFKRAVAFDRKSKGSIVTRQMGRRCCSDEFANDLINKFNIPYKIDTNAYYTDTAVFMDIIPECTNISAGGYNEHFTNEYVDISYTEKVAESALKINWDSLKTSRVLINDNKNTERLKNIKSKYCINILNTLEKYDLLNTNRKEYLNLDNDYLLFNGWFEDYNIKIYPNINTSKMIFNGSEILFNNSIDLDRILSYMFGVMIDYDLFEIKNEDIILYNDGIEINGMYIEWDNYLKYFNSINNDNTSYVWDDINIQWYDISNITLNKKQVNVLINDIIEENKK